MNLRWRTAVPVAALAVVVVAVTVVLVTGGSGASESCAQTVDKVSAEITGPSAHGVGLRLPVVVASFSACGAPDAWRLRAEHDRIAPALGALLHDPSLTTDVALDQLCAHFDSYNMTATCKLRQKPGGAGLS